MSGAALAGASALASLFGSARAVAQAQDKNASGKGKEFSAETVRNRAKALADSDFEKPTVDLPKPFAKLSEDLYRDIAMRDRRVIWRGEDNGFEVKTYPRGWIFDTPVELWLVDKSEATQLNADQKMFAFGSHFTNVPQAAPYHFSGFSLSSEIHQAGKMDDMAWFQGASYFRAVGKNNEFGTFARGLAINTARRGGEEFPVFRSFWIEKPRPRTSEVVVHALLDSPSVTGAYTFRIFPQLATVIHVDMTIFPRKELDHVGIAPLTSMYLKGPASSRQVFDTRPRVHSADGLAMVAGSGERILRPITNPTRLQVSSFVDNSPAGFGLVQRANHARAFKDLESNFEQRPSVWVEPKQRWGKGFVELVEIPTSDDIHDNIVAYWRPTQNLQPGRGYRYVYRLSFGPAIPAPWTPSVVEETRVGAGKAKGMIAFQLDFTDSEKANAGVLPAVDVWAAGEAIGDVVVRRNPATGGIRAAFQFDPGDRELIELRAVMRSDAGSSETWLYRWTSP